MPRGLEFFFVGKSNFSFQTQINLDREQSKDGGKKKCGHWGFVDLVGVQSQQNGGGRKAAAAQKVKGNQKFPLKRADPRGPKLDQAGHPDDRKKCGKTQQDHGHEHRFLNLAGVDR